MCSVIAVGPKVHVFKSAEGDGFLRAIKNRQHAFRRGESKAVGPMSYDLTAC
jgi:hypothetical protein